MKKYLVFATMILATEAFAEKWDVHNNPFSFKSFLNANVITRLSELPSKARLDDERLAWSETYWPSNKGSIAYRWNSPDPQPFHFRLNSKSDVLAMSLEQISQLSPAELYDISQGDYNYTLTKKVLSLVSPKDLWWEGICHGWSLAAASYPEPAKVIVTNPDGVRVPFGSSDVKALLSMHEAYNSRGLYVRVGERCSAHGKVPGEASSHDGPQTMPAPEVAESDICRDINAGSFHIVLTNLIGIHSKSFVADIDRFNDIWNQPILGYESQILQEAPATSAQMQLGIAKTVRVLTVMSFGDELTFPGNASTSGQRHYVSKEPITGTVDHAIGTRKYEYILELNQNGEIVGGEWVSITRPDFLWIKKRDNQFVNGVMPLGGLMKIYRPLKY